MKNIFRWKFANKLSIIFSIIAGFYLIYQLFNYVFSDMINLNTEIEIIEY